jgi:hypothetical protein
MFRRRSTSSRLRRAPAAAGLAAALACAGALTAPAPVAGAAATAARHDHHGSRVPIPSVTGPITGGTTGHPANAMPPRFSTVDHYTENEYFVSGTATAYAANGTWGTNGRWSIRPTTTAPYETRILVRRPADPARFNGTVVVEWMNVSAGTDEDVDWGFAHDELVRDGFAYVGVSVQKAGIYGGGGIPGITLTPLKVQDPVRYAPLVHPGDDYSYSIFSQAGALVRHHASAAVDPLGGLHVRHIVADGESQSAFRMVTYANAVQPRDHVFDAFLIHSRGANASGINAATPGPDVAHIRSDLPQPVLQFQTETDLFGLGFYPARQADTRRLRTWEVAGTSHVDQFELDYQVEALTGGTATHIPGFPPGCATVNDGPQHDVLDTAYASLRSWLVRGQAPAHGTPFAVASGDIARDADGNAIGGIRTPAVDVPVATYTGIGTPGRGCFLFGTTTPFSAATLLARYPTHATYVRKVARAADRAEDKRFLLPADEKAIVDAARAAAIPN